MSAEPPSRPRFNFPPDTPPFIPPQSLHPTLATIDIRDWSYPVFASQIIILNIPVVSINSVERLWLEELENLRSRKEIYITYRSFIKQLIDFQVAKHQGEMPRLYTQC